MKLVTERKTVSEDPNYSPGRSWLKWFATAVALIVVYEAATKMSFGTTAKDYNLSTTEAACSVAYVGTLVNIDGREVSVEVSVSCATAPATMHLTLQLQYRATSAGTWTNVGKPSQFNAPPSAIDQRSYVYANATCAVGQFQSVYTLTGTGKATGDKFSYPPTPDTVRTVQKGECQ